MILRRVVGDSMQPTLAANQLVLGIKSIKPKLGRLVIVEHNGKEIVKRLTKIDGEKLYIKGDNANSSLDSRQLGWTSQKHYLATVIWPKKL